MYLNLLKNEQKKAFLNVAYELINIDKFVAEEEKDLINQYCSEMNISDYNHDTSQFNNSKEILAESNQKIRNAIYIELFALANCEEHYDEKEKIFLNEIRGIFNISNVSAKHFEELVTTLNSVYKEMNSAIGTV